ncbi:pantoate--beta-alanine ligase [Gemmatimonadota bacterium]
MIVTETRRGLSEALSAPREAGSRVALVPTMGYLHEGHLSLVGLARADSDFLAVSVFVNPLQFGPDEDLDRYPRDLDRDLSALRAQGVDLVFHPCVDEMYLSGEPRITVDPGEMGRVLCGAYRPVHFRGVLTVVARLFGLFSPTVAFFGQKDYQQLTLVRRMVQDLELGVEVLFGPTVREEDGLALSSRNVFLSPEERRDAPGLVRALALVQEAFSRGERSGAALRHILEQEAGSYPRLRMQYGEVVHPETLEPVDPVFSGSVVAVAGFCGATRLIDNRILEG